MTQAAPTTAQRSPDLSPSGSLLHNFRQELTQHPPFAQMTTSDVDYFLSHARQHYFAPEEILVEPVNGVVQQLFYIRQGAVTGTLGLAEQMGGAFEYEAGDLFPVSAAVAGRAVTATYRACADTFVLALPVSAMKSLAQRSPVFTEFLNLRTTKFLELSRKALQAAYASHSVAEQTLERALGELISTAPVTCSPDTPLRQALERMHKKRIGSMLVTDPAGAPVGILTRYDILGRITLAQVSLDAPISQVMVHPVLTLTTQNTAQDAALLMSRHGMRHVPVTRDGVAVGMVSERDLFAMQKQSLKNVSSAIRSAPDVATLKSIALDIRRLARSLLGQGVQARQLTALISHLNDVLTGQLLKLKADEHGIDLNRLCWLCLGSEGRDEQTIATDQDNALILPNDTSDESREAIRAFAKEVNLALDACGYPLCHGGIMAGEAACCLTLDEWRERFRLWIEQGSPQDLLNASIYFDFRALAGDKQLAATLRQEVMQAARITPRFHKQMALNALTRSAPLNWRGAVDTDDQGTVDLKLQGTAIFVDAARLYSLAHGIDETNTRKRLEAVGPLMNLADTEYGAWVGGFEFLQILRLRIQLESQVLPDGPNRIVVATLNDIDRRILRESFRVARQLQQRLQLDYQR
jgi:CBS domain-containing protein